MTRALLFLAIVTMVVGAPVRALAIPTPVTRVEPAPIKTLAHIELMVWSIGPRKAFERLKTPSKKTDAPTRPRSR